VKRAWLQEGLNAFARQFAAQIEGAGTPASEHAIHFCLALGFQAAHDLDPGSIVFEKPAGRGRIDLWVVPFDLLVEVKFRRAIPSGRNLPATQVFGSLLADFNKIGAAPATTRLVLLVSDKLGVSYLENSGRGLLPLHEGAARVITADDVQALPQTAAKNAVADGQWKRLETELIWKTRVAEWALLAWEVRPRMID